MSIIKDNRQHTREEDEQQQHEEREEEVNEEEEHIVEEVIVEQTVVEELSETKIENHEQIEMAIPNSRILVLNKSPGSAISSIATQQLTGSSCSTANSLLTAAVSAASASTAPPSVITLHNAHYLDVRKSLLLHKALVEDPKQGRVVVVCATTPTTTATVAVSPPTAATSCIRPTTSAVNDCEPD